MQSIQNECLDHFVTFGERHLEFLLREYEDHYNTVRPHQGIENRSVEIVTTTPPGDGLLAPVEIECELRLGGLLRHYYLKAA